MSLAEQAGPALERALKSGVEDTGHFKVLFFTSLGVMGALLLGVLVGAMVLWRRYQRTTRTLVSFARKMDSARQADAASVDELRQTIMTALSEQHQDKWMNRVMQRRGAWPADRDPGTAPREGRSAAGTDLPPKGDARPTNGTPPQSAAGDPYPEPRH